MWTLSNPRKQPLFGELDHLIGEQILAGVQTIDLAPDQCFEFVGQEKPTFLLFRILGCSGLFSTRVTGLECELQRSLQQRVVSISCHRY